MMSSVPIVLTIAGSDCSSGAGVQADLKTFTHFGCYGLTALTSVVAETSLEVRSFSLLEPNLIKDQIDVMLESLPVKAGKTGMLGDRPQIEAVVEALDKGPKFPLVVDPVMVATSGARLLAEDATEALTSLLFPKATLLTPNLDEAAVLLGRELLTRKDMEVGGKELGQRYQCAVLVKGGHLKKDEAPDLLVEGDGMTWYEGSRIHGVQTHGTGCTYSAAIAARLALGDSLQEAVATAKQYLRRAIEKHYQWNHIDALNHQQR